MEAWKKEAVSLQKKFNVSYSSWFNFAHRDQEIIKLYIGSILFGVENCNDAYFMSVKFYDESKQNVINSIFDRMSFQKDQNIFLRHTFVIGKTEDGQTNDVCDVVFRYKARFFDVHFIDRHGRLYENWENFLENNVLPACEFSFPEDGIYHRDARIKFAKSPKAGIVSTIMEYVGVGSNVAGVGSVVTTTIATTGLVSLGPIAMGTVVGVGVVAGGYTVAKSVYNLIDRIIHGQSVSLDSSAGIEWLNIGAGASAAISGLAMKMAPLLIKAAGSQGKTVAGILVACNVLNLGFDAAFMIVSINDIVTKINEGGIESLTTQDIMIVSLQIFAICGAVVSIKDTTRYLMEINPSGSPKLNLPGKSKSIKAKAVSGVGDLPETSWRIRYPVGDSIVVTNRVENILNHVLYHTPKLFTLLISHTAPKYKHILTTLNIISKITCDYWEKKINTLDYIRLVGDHMRNLWIIYKSEITDLMNFLRRQYDRLFGNEESSEAIGLVLDNSVVEILDASEQSDENASETDPDMNYVRISSTNVNRVSAVNVNRTFATRDISKYLFDYVRSAVYCITYHTSAIAYRHDNLKLLKIVEKVGQVALNNFSTVMKTLHEEHTMLFSNNCSIIGKENAKRIMFSVGFEIGADNSAYLFEKTMERVMDRENLRMMFDGSCVREYMAPWDNPCPLLPEILDNAAEKVNSILETVVLKSRNANENVRSLNDILGNCERIFRATMNGFITEFDHRISKAGNLYNQKKSTLGEENVRALLHRVCLDYDNDGKVLEKVLEKVSNVSGESLLNQYGFNGRETSNFENLFSRLDITCEMGNLCDDNVLIHFDSNIGDVVRGIISRLDENNKRYVKHALLVEVTMELFAKLHGKYSEMAVETRNKKMKKVILFVTEKFVTQLELLNGFIDNNSQVLGAEGARRALESIGIDMSLDDYKIIFVAKNLLSVAAQEQMRGEYIRQVETGGNLISELRVPRPQIWEYLSKGENVEIFQYYEEENMTGNIYKKNAEIYFGVSLDEVTVDAKEGVVFLRPKSWNSRCEMVLFLTPQDAGEKIGLMMLLKPDCGDSDEDD